MLANRSVPAAGVIPELAYPDVREAARWLCEAFGFEVRLHIGGHRIQLTCGDGALVLIEGEASPGGDRVMVRVEDAAAHRERAQAQGAAILSEPADFPFGERQYAARDFAGRIWVFSQSIADVDPRDWGGEPG